MLCSQEPTGFLKTPVLSEKESSVKFCFYASMLKASSVHTHSFQEGEKICIIVVVN